MANLTMLKGKTFQFLFRWEQEPVIYKPITAITNAAPVALTVPSHGVPNGWRVAVVSVKGMAQINAAHSPPWDGDYHKATAVDANTVQLNTVNAADYDAYISGGYLQYNTPVDLAGYTARMSIKDKVGGTELLRLDTSNGRVVIDNALKVITLLVSAATTAAMTWNRGVYDLEMVDGSGNVYLLASGTVVASNEVTTT